MKGIVARTIQHEVDHLQGILFTDKMEKGTLRHELYTEKHEVNLRDMNRRMTINRQ